MVRPNETFFIRHATAVAILALTFVMLMAAGVFWREEMANQEAREWVNHTYEVIGHIESLSGDITDAMVGVRGFLLTGNEIFLEPYSKALRETPAEKLTTALQQHRSVMQELAVIGKMTGDNITQQSNLEELQVVVRELLAYMAQNVEMRRDGSVAEVDMQHGKNLMDDMRNVVRIMAAEETHLLELRTEADRLGAEQNMKTVFFGIGFFYLAMALSIWVYQRGRARAQAQMLHYTRELERSEEELKMQQEELKASNEEIEASNEELEEKTKALEEQNAQIQQQAEELEESQKLIEEKAKEVERASRYKSEFLANMSHELRTPLNSLLILAKMLAANEEGNLTVEQVEEANVIHNGGLELLGLINDILDLSKVEAGKLSLTVEDVALESFVTRMQQQFNPVANDRKVAFHTEVDPELPMLIRTDAQRVEQILKNLLSNAFKFTEHGTVTLRVRKPERAETQRASLDYAHSIALSVTDTGIGIQTSKLKDIFEAFQQEDGSIDRHYGGTGLGLTIARKFAHMLGGEIHVSSVKGQGSTFTLILPLKLTPSERVEVEEDTADRERPEVMPMPKTWVAEFIVDDRKNVTAKDKVLLIVEDDAEFAGTLMKIARKRGYKCLVAGDGKSGLVMAMEEPVTAILLDLTLPDIDGTRVLEQLKQSLKTRHIPVHIVSGRAEAQEVIPLRQGAMGYLTKPVQQEAIEDALTKMERLMQAEMKHVLVVEDDANNQVAIQALLKKNDVEITVAGTAAEASAAMAKQRFDCIILDLQLPDMTGFQWLESLEAAGQATALPPVIVYTARELDEEENRRLSRYTGNIIIKGAKSPERLLDEVTLFLHSVESSLSADQQEIIRMQHNPDKALEGRTVLLVDDDLRNTFALSKLLKARGIHVVIADNGQMALDKLREDQGIELVIMDIMMPVMDGYQAMQEIRAQKAYCDLPILALTARAMPDEQEKCMAAGANDYLTKPVDIAHLLTLLRVCLFRQDTRQDMAA